MTKFTIVILTMNRLHSLQRLVRSLMHKDCQYGQFGMTVDIEFHIDRPKSRMDDGGWLDLIRWTANVTWPYGTVTSLVATKNMGLRGSWFHAWKPESDQDRAIILEDTMEVSPPWFLWVNEAYDAYSGESSVAGFRLQRQDFVALKDGRRARSEVSSNSGGAFLYSLPGHVGFAPNARVWTDFLDWAECAVCDEEDVSLEGMVAPDWWERTECTQLWSQYLMFHMHQKDLYCLYQFPKDERAALGLRWEERGDDFRATTSASHDKVRDMGAISFPEIGSIETYDWGANLLHANRSSSPRSVLPIVATKGANATVHSTFLGRCRETGKFERKKVPGGGYVLVPIIKPPESSGSPFQLASELLSATMDLGVIERQSGRPCLVTSYSEDGIGHQMEAKLSCIAAAAASGGSLAYAHRPMDAAHHGADPLGAELFFGISRALSGIPSALAFDNETMVVKERSPLPWRGMCAQQSWFDKGIRNRACAEAANEPRRAVFEADNCFDEFYCGMMAKDPAATARIWREDFLPALRRTLMLPEGTNHTSTFERGPGVLSIAVHARRGDAKSRGAKGWHVRAITLGLARAWNGTVDVVVHTDGARTDVLNEIGIEAGGDTGIRVRAYGSGDGKTLELACMDFVQADVFLASDSTRASPVRVRCTGTSTLGRLFTQTRAPLDLSWRALNGAS